MNAGPQVLYPEDVVRDAVACMAVQIAASSCSQCLHLVGVLDGGRWLADRLEPALHRQGIETTRSFVRVHRSQGDGVLGPPEIDEEQDKSLTRLQDRCVLLVDDICDEGETLHLLSERAGGLAWQVRSAVVIERLQARPSGFSPTFSALTTIERGWLVGCGMDSHGRYRELPFIGIVEA